MPVFKNIFLLFLAGYQVLKVSITVNLIAWSLLYHCGGVNSFVKATKALPVMAKFVCLPPVWQWLSYIRYHCIVLGNTSLLVTNHKFSLDICQIFLQRSSSYLQCFSPRRCPLLSENCLFRASTPNLTAYIAMNKSRWYLCQKKTFLSLIFCSLFFQITSHFYIRNWFQEKKFKFHLNVGFLGPPGKPIKLPSPLIGILSEFSQMMSEGMTVMPQCKRCYRI